MKDFNAGDKKRDARLRRKLLFVLYLARANSPTGFISGRRLVDDAGGLAARDCGFESDDHALALARDLCNAGYATEKPLGYLRRGERFGLDHCQFAITSIGTKLHLEQMPPDVLVDDERISDGE